MKTKIQQTAHTPGPWSHRAELGTVNAIDPLHSADGRARIEICDPSNGQTWNGAPLPIDEREANARLIAAAPELLAALENLDDAAGRYQALVHTDGAGKALDEIREAHNQARSAIAKAKGGAS